MIFYPLNDMRVILCVLLAVAPGVGLALPTFTARCGCIATDLSAIGIVAGMSLQTLSISYSSTHTSKGSTYRYEPPCQSTIFSADNVTCGRRRKGIESEHPATEGVFRAMNFYGASDLSSPEMFQLESSPEKRHTTAGSRCRGLGPSLTGARDGKSCAFYFRMRAPGALECSKFLYTLIMMIMISCNTFRDQESPRSEML